MEEPHLEVCASNIFEVMNDAGHFREDHAGPITLSSARYAYVNSQKANPGFAEEGGGAVRGLYQLIFVDLYIKLTSACTRAPSRCCGT